MGTCTCMTGVMMCSFGAAPATLIANAQTTTLVSNMVAGTIMDNKPVANIPPFGMCSTTSNPAVAAATAAAKVLTPQPCMPVIAAPWVPGSPTVLIGGKPALNNSSKCMCSYGGVISINYPGQVTVSVP